MEERRSSEERKTPEVIMGIDPGTNILGYGVIRVGKSRPEYVAMGILDMRKIPGHFDRIGFIRREVSRLVSEYSPDVMSIESPFYGKNAQVILKLGRAQGAAVSAASDAGIPVFEYAPRKAKIAITGNGAASKEQVCLMSSRLLGVDFAPEHLDATDALALALCHYFHLKSPIPASGGSSDWKKFIAENPGRVK